MKADTALRSAHETATGPVAGLALPLLAATQLAAVACRPWAGKGEPELADGAAVAALRQALAGLPGRARVVIGEGEKDQAPMLYAGEELGLGGGPDCDLAVDPLEGTKLCASGQGGAVSVLAAAPPRSLWVTPGWYLEKLVVGAAAAGAVSLANSTGQNLAALAAALAKPVGDLVVAVQDRPRHSRLVADCRRAGARVVLFAHGDVMMSLLALMPGGGIDALFGVGGAPEGVITACAARLLGGDMEARLAPQSAAEQAMLGSRTTGAAGTPVDRILRLDDLVASSDCVFAATGVTSGSLLAGPRPAPGGGWEVSSVLASPGQPGLRVEGVVAGPRHIDVR